MSEHEGPGGVRRGRRARWFVVAAIVVVVLGTTSVVVLTRVAAGASREQAPPPQVETVAVAKTDLTERESADGTLGYGDELSLAGRKPGTLTSLPSIGATIERGKAVYGLDAKPVPLFYGALPFYRDLAEGAEDGLDVKELEENLKALGFGTFGKPDDKFTAATATALKKWQKSLGLPETGAFAQGDVVLEPGPIRIASIAAELGGQGGGQLMKVTGTEKVITANLDADKQSIAKEGAKAGLDITGGKTTTGTITAVGTTAVEPTDSSSGGNGNAKITVTIRLDDPSAAASLDATPVTVTFTKGERKGVLAVPVGALLALAEGGYAVEVDEAGERRLIAVETGLFTGGNVEISGPELHEGMRVVTTS
jgi:peptidoglycan hydrolase-like protein with peptidoglycan-binding domain